MSAPDPNIIFYLPPKPDAIAAFPGSEPKQWHLFSATQLQPNPRDYVTMLQKTGSLPPGEVFVEELGPRQCYTFEGDAVVRFVTEIRLP
jgi:hypothetical protein